MIIFGCCDLFDCAVLGRKEGRKEGRKGGHNANRILYYCIDSFIRFAHVINYLLILGGKEGLSDLIIHKLSSRLICLNFPQRSYRKKLISDSFYSIQMIVRRENRSSKVLLALLREEHFSKLLLLY